MKCVALNTACVVVVVVVFAVLVDEGTRNQNKQSWCLGVFDTIGFLYYYRLCHDRI